jgi:hypothetical protein
VSNPPGGRGWGWFAFWGLAGATVSFSFLTGFSIGLFVLPAALALLVVAARRSPHLPEAIGFAAGVGAVLLAVAFLNRGSTACPASGSLKLDPGQTSASCGGLDPHPWLYAGLALVAGAVTAYAFLSRRRLA